MVPSTPQGGSVREAPRGNRHRRSDSRRAVRRARIRPAGRAGLRDQGEPSARQGRRTRVPGQADQARRGHAHRSGALRDSRGRLPDPGDRDRPRPAWRPTCGRSCARTGPTGSSRASSRSRSGRRAPKPGRFRTRRPSRGAFRGSSRSWARSTPSSQRGRRAVPAAHVGSRTRGHDAGLVLLDGPHPRLHRRRRRARPRLGVADRTGQHRPDHPARPFTRSWIAAPATRPPT